VIVLKFVDPRGNDATVIEPYTLSKNLKSGESSATTVALLANGFPDSENFLRAVGKALKKRLPDLHTKVWNKGDAAIEASDKIVAEIVADCHVAIAAYGH
jgi:hypothetical protein